MTDAGGAITVAAIAGGLGILIGTAIYDDYKTNSYNEVVERQTIKCGDANGDLKITKQEREAFYQNFIRDSQLIQVEGKNGYYTQDGQEADYDVLTNLVKNYCPKDTGSAGVLETIEGEL